MIRDPDTPVGKIRIQPIAQLCHFHSYLNAAAGEDQGKMGGNSKKLSLGFPRPHGGFQTAIGPRAHIDNSGA
jgi:hypothetical protein